MKKGILILDTSTIRFLYEKEILSNVVLSCRCFIPRRVRNEIDDDIRCGEIANTKNIYRILQEIKIFEDAYIKLCYNKIINSIKTEIDNKTVSIQTIRSKADKDCIFLCLRLRLEPEHKNDHVYLIADDFELKCIAEKIFKEQLVGTVFFSSELLFYLSIRKILNLNETDLLSKLKDFGSTLQREWKKEIYEKMKLNMEHLCPYNCTDPCT